SGVPQTAEQRFAIAKRILDAALRHGIAREDLWIDCLTLTVSAQQEQARETLRALRMVREELGLQTVLGVSNISFGLPNRPLVTRTFLVEALHAGLTLPILNPNQTELMDAVAAFRVLSGEDEGSRAYIARFADYVPPKTAAAAPAAKKTTDSAAALTLDDAVIRGLRAEAAALAREALSHEDELSIVDGHLIPALDVVGEGYEAGRVFLPQLLSAAQAAQAVFEVIRESAARKGAAAVKKGRLLVATVRGDVHDIGKNIVKTVLENYGYEVVDLGRDVAPETIAAAVREQQIRLVGLSALMTTTLAAMEETVALLRTLPEPPKTFVGGAVVTPEYAARIGADYYARDAKASVEVARRVLG
nr:cobalamin-dependent protein [Oscillospiraceae bacterium]